MKQPFKTITEFKRILEVGDKLNIVRRGKDLGVLTVTKAQSGSFAVGIQKEGGWVQNSWLDYPKAANCQIKNNALIIADSWIMKGDTKAPEGEAVLIIKFDDFSTCENGCCYPTANEKCQDPN